MGILARGLLPGQSESPAVSTLKLVHEFNGAYLLDVAPDGKSVGLYLTSNPTETFTERMGQWFREEAHRERDELQIVELGSWRVKNSARLRALASLSSFFVDGQTMLVHTSVYRDDDRSMRQVAIVGPLNGEFSEKTQVLSAKGVSYRAASYYAVKQGLAVGVETTSAGNDALILVALPNYSERARVPFSVEPPRRDGQRAHQTDLYFSGDREHFVYGEEDYVVCRQTQDLGIVWKRKVGRPWHFSITPTGDYVAATFVSGFLKGGDAIGHVEIYNGRDGSPLTRLPMKGFDGVGISPDGKLMATSDLIFDPRTDTRESTVHLYDVGTGRELQKVVHGILKHEHTSAGLFGPRGIQFTSDGKYLITSTPSITKVWELAA